MKTCQIEFLKALVLQRCKREKVVLTAEEMREFRRIGTRTGTNLFFKRAHVHLTMKDVETELGSFVYKLRIDCGQIARFLNRNKDDPQALKAGLLQPQPQSQPQSQPQPEPEPQDTDCLLLEIPAGSIDYRQLAAGIIASTTSITSGGFIESFSARIQSINGEGISADDKAAIGQLNQWVEEFSNPEASLSSDKKKLSNTLSAISSLSLVAVAIYSRDAVKDKSEILGNIVGMFSWFATSFMCIYGNRLFWRDVLSKHQTELDFLQDITQARKVGNGVLLIAKLLFFGAPSAVGSFRFTKDGLFSHDSDEGLTPEGVCDKLLMAISSGRCINIYMAVAEVLMLCSFVFPAISNTAISSVAIDCARRSDLVEQWQKVHFTANQRHSLFQDKSGKYKHHYRAALKSLFAEEIRILQRCYREDIKNRAQEWEDVRSKLQALLQQFSRKDVGRKSSFLKAFSHKAAEIFLAGWSAFSTYYYAEEVGGSLGLFVWALNAIVINTALQDIKSFVCKDIAADRSVAFGATVGVIGAITSALTVSEQNIHADGEIKWETFIPSVVSAAATAVYGAINLSLPAGSVRTKRGNLIGIMSNLSDAVDRLPEKHAEHLHGMLLAARLDKEEKTLLPAPTARM
jgi:hypothetical protein